MKSLYENTKKVYDKLGKKYLKDSSKLVPLERLDFSKLFSKGSSILDVGCGGGRDAKFFVQKGLSVTGVDFSPVLIDEAKKLVPKGDFHVADLLTMKLPKNSYDGIWAQAVLLHLERKDVPKAIKSFFNILKPKGILHIRVKKGKGEEFVSEKISGWNERFYTYFSKKEIEDMLKKQGFKIIHSKICPDELKRPGVSWVVVWGVKK